MRTLTHHVTSSCHFNDRHATQWAKWSWCSTNCSSGLLHGTPRWGAAQAFLWLFTEGQSHPWKATGGDSWAPWELSTSCSSDSVMGGSVHNRIMKHVCAVCAFACGLRGQCCVGTAAWAVLRGSASTPSCVLLLSLSLFVSAPYSLCMLYCHREGLDSLPRS